MPAANQAFRESVAGRPLARGVGEMSLGEIAVRASQRRSEPRAATVASESVHVLEFFWHLRIALAASPLVFVIFALRAFRTIDERRRRTLLGLVIAGTFVACFTLIGPVWISLALAGGTPPGLMAWTPNLCVLAIAVGLRAARTTGENLSTMR